MPIEINNFFNDVNTSVFNIIGLNRIFSSVIYTSLLLTVIVMVIIIFIYPYKKNTATYIYFKCFLYVLIAITIIFALHSSFVRTYYRAKFQDDKLNSFVSRVNGGNYSDEVVPVEPKQLPLADDRELHDGDMLDSDLPDEFSSKHNSVSDILDSINV